MRYQLRSQPAAGGALYQQARDEGESAGAGAARMEIDYDRLRRTARTIFALHCGDGDRPGGEPFRWRNGGSFVDDWDDGCALFMDGYAEGYINACLARAARGVPLVAVPLAISGATGVLRRARDVYTVLVRPCEDQEPITSRSATAVGAIIAVQPRVDRTAEPCVASGASGALCRQPALMIDPDLGGKVCPEHAPRRGRLVYPPTSLAG